MKIIINIFLILIISSCIEDKKNVEFDTNLEKEKTKLSSLPECPEYLMKRKNNNLNVSILLDLSSRIDVPNQQANDSSYIVSIANVFNAHVKKKKLGLLKDKIQVLFHPTPKNSKINELSEKLKISYVKGDSKNELIGKTERMYQSLPSEIYNLAREDYKKTKEYPGSDIWRFFKDDVNDYSIDQCYRNIVVIITDGYMYYENTKMIIENRTSYLTPKYLGSLPLNNSDWLNIMDEKDFGFITDRENLNNLEVLVLGVQSLNESNPYSPDIITEYWEKWLAEMGIENYKVKKSDLPSNVESVINDFINGQ